MVAHTFNPSTLGVRGRWVCCEFKISVVYIETQVSQGNVVELCL